MLFGVTAEECRSSVEPKTAKVGLATGDRRELLDDRGGDVLGTVTGRINGETPERCVTGRYLGHIGVWEVGGVKKWNTY